MGNNSSDNFRRALEDAGIPPNVIDYVLQYKLVQDYKLLTSCLLLFIVTIGFVSIFIIYNKLERINGTETERYAKSIDGILYNNSSGIGLIAAFFGIIFASSSATGWVTTLSQRAVITSFVLGLSESKIPRLFKWINRWQIDRLSSESDPALYVRKFERGRIRIFATLAALLLTISVLVTMREAETHEIFTSTAYVTSPFFPWEAPTSHNWTSAVSVETGCNHVSGWRGPDDDDIEYDITFSDGTVAHMGTATPIGSSWPRAAEVIDRKLRAAGATFSPWTWLLQDSYDPRCIAALRKRFSQRDFERVKALLRVPE